MHSFFLERDGNFNSEAGRVGLLAELVSTEQLLDNARVTVNAMRIAMCRSLGVPDMFSPPAEQIDGRERRDTGGMKDEG